MSYYDFSLFEASASIGVSIRAFKASVSITTLSSSERFLLHEGQLLTILNLGNLLPTLTFLSTSLQAFPQDLHRKTDYVKPEEDMILKYYP